MSTSSYKTWSTYPCYRVSVFAEAEKMDWEKEKKERERKPLKRSDWRISKLY